jgi:adenylosuccinate lyase
MEEQRELGLAIPDEAIAELRAHLDDADLAVVAQYERRFRHDVMAHVHALGDQAPAARPFLHLGATSAYVTDNADLLVMHEGMRLLLGRLVALLRAFGAFAGRHAALPCLAYTHFQPAQLTTVGKRATLWAQDFALDAEELCHRLETMRFRGCKGTTGTQASFLELLGGDHAKVRELDRRVSERMGVPRPFAVSGQTYSRKQDSVILDALSGLAQSAGKLAGDLRLLQHEGELLEPFESEQIGSSAMAYKRNPMRAERISALARFLISLQQNTGQTAASQWLERTLDDSANRRLVLPEAFLAADAILILATNIVTGLEVREAVIQRRVTEQMPFMATERWLMLGVGAGGDRQSLHEVIRRHSLLVAEAVSRGAPNDLLDRLAADPAFRSVPAEALRAELDPASYTGRAEQQVGEFLTEYLHPLLERARPLAAETGGAEVRV